MLYYEKRDGYCIITGCSSQEAHVEIPSYYESLPVMEIAAGVFRKNEALTSVKIPMHLQRIGENCFNGCQKLTSICVADAKNNHSVFPPALMQIGAHAFENSGITTLTFNSPYLDFGKHCFRGSALQDVYIHDAIQVTFQEGAFADCHDLVNFSCSNTVINGLPMHCFAHCGKLRQIVAGELLGEIAAGCFYECSSLEDLPVRKPLRQIGAEAFAGCRELNMNAYFSSMRNCINAYGSNDLLELIVKQRTTPCRWMRNTEYEFYTKHIENTAKMLLRKIQSAPPAPVTDTVLLRILCSEFYGEAGWTYGEHFALLSKKEILSKFHHIPDFDIITEYNDGDLRPPMRPLDTMSMEDVLRVLSYESAVTCKPFSWEDDLSLLLDAELVGDASLYQSSLALDFLDHLLDAYLHPAWKDGDCYDISNKLLVEKLSENDFTGEIEKLCYLKYGVLLNRIFFYREVKRAAFQISAALWKSQRRISNASDI